MVRPTMWRVLALAAAMGAGFAAPAMAQIIIGEQSSPSVVVDWSVLDNLGQQPSLADMVRGRPLQAPAASAAAAAAGKKPVAYAPYQPGKKGAAAAPQQGKFVPYQPGAKQPAAAVTPGYQPGKFVPYQPDTKKAPTAKTTAVKPAAAKVAAPAKAKPVPAEPVAASGLDAIKAEVKRAETAAPAPTSTSTSTPVTPVAAPAKMPEPASLKAVEDAVKTDAPRVAAPVPLTPAPLAENARQAEVKPVAPAVIASAAPSVALPSILTPPPAVAVEPAKDTSPAPATSHGGGDTLTILFAGDSSGVPDSVRGDLDRLAQRMMKKDSLGLQLLAYADGDDSNASKARRLSLSRALEVRKYLMDQGIRSTRIEVRALGNKTEGNGPADRVEAVLVGK